MIQCVQQPERTTPYTLLLGMVFADLCSVQMMAIVTVAALPARHQMHRPVRDCRTL